MKTSFSSVESLVYEIKKEMFLNQDIHHLVSPSAYDTAWLTMIPDPTQVDKPKFESCLNWVLNNQNAGGFWGESYAEDLPTIDTLPATLASMVALKTWNLGEENIARGLAFIHTTAEVILEQHRHHLPRWFAIVLPAMTELAQAAGLDLVFSQRSKRVLSDLFHQRQQILKMTCMENPVDYSQQKIPSLLWYLESLPPTYHVDEQNIMKHVSGDGSIFQSPAATASAYLRTGSSKCLEYLEFLVQKCPNGVPAEYPLDEELIKLCLVDHVQRLGLAEHFEEEIEDILKLVYKNLRKQDFEPTNRRLVAAKLYKDALAFRLLRMQGHDVKPSCFCWFLQHADTLEYIEQNCEQLTSVLYNVYRATDVMFRREYELEEARAFSRKLLEKSISFSCKDDDLVIFPGLHKLIKHELTLPWITRLDQLDQRMWIEENKISPLWIGKASFYRLFHLQHEKLVQLANENYKLRQSVYAEELEQLRRWSKESGLREIGFGREKTAYCYFAVAASSCLPRDSVVRLIVAKIAILITVADDFYDVEGSTRELKILTKAIQRWNGEDLTGHSKIIFDALCDLVMDISRKYNHQREGSKFLKGIRDIWQETFGSWMVERTWSDTGYRASLDEYLDIGMISIGAHTIILPACCFLSQDYPIEKLKPDNYGKITKLFMSAARLLNDTQSYQKEQKDGKMNMVLLHLDENPNAKIDGSIAYVKGILEEKTKEFLEIVLMDDGPEEMPKSCKHFHLSCMKVFHMFFNSTNLFDSEEELLNDIKKAICIPPDLDSQISDLYLPPPPEKEEILQISARWDVNTTQHFLHGNGKESVV
ncbi:(E,E)-geranyllinalool synthase-like isoform X2 [Coffea eugenioides]|uniref:(E,E)-geranyllinalool synthase-like isoform X2 n=1 Tax=Coffea eugenioides TaxID=49369 RepID=UPI000F608583|nr:(E,E)-geranyllinalool synthase-like isoform X2 [Coffea eugenioides]